MATIITIRAVDPPIALLPSRPSIPRGRLDPANRAVASGKVKRNPVGCNRCRKAGVGGRKRCRPLVDPAMSSIDGRILPNCHSAGPRGTVGFTILPHHNRMRIVAALNERSSKSNPITWPCLPGISRKRSPRECAQKASSPGSSWRFPNFRPARLARRERRANRHPRRRDAGYLHRP
jgi:hypothetical protein